MPESSSLPFADPDQFRIGLLTNPRSGGNRKGDGSVAAFLRDHPEIRQAEGTTPTEIATALSTLAAQQVDLLVINGGDGTVQATLTALYGAGPCANPPLLALLRSGTSSMLARDVGVGGTPLEALRRIVARNQAGRIGPGDMLQRPVLRVHRPAGESPLCGMFFGTGAICRGIELSHSRINPRGIRGELMPGLVLARLVLALLTGNRRQLPPVPLDIRVQEEQLPQSHYLLALVTTLERLFLGLTPFWGSGTAALQFTALGPAPKGLVRSIPSLLRGKQHRLMTADNGYFSQTAEQLEITLNGRFTLDGELFNSNGPLRLEAVGPVRFLRL